MAVAWDLNVITIGGAEAQSLEIKNVCKKLGVGGSHRANTVKYRKLILYSTGTVRLPNLQL